VENQSSGPSAHSIPHKGLDPQPTNSVTLMLEQRILQITDCGSCNLKG